MRRLCSHSSCGNARLDANVNPASGTCVPGTDELDSISLDPFPTTEDKRAGGDLVWCSPCGHLYFRSGIERWMKASKACPICREFIRELVPYGMSVAGYEASKLAREAERALAAEEERRRDIARLPLVRMEEEALRIRFKAAREETCEPHDKLHRAKDWCSRELDRNESSRLPSDPVFGATCEVCYALSENMDILREMLNEYVHNVGAIQENEGQYAIDRNAYNPRFYGAVSVMDDTAKRRRENVGLVPLALYALEHEPRRLDADEYEVFMSNVPVSMDISSRYTATVRALVAGLRELDAALFAAGLPVRPWGQTVPEFLRSVGRRDGGSRAHGGNRNWGPRASGGSSSSGVVYSLSADDIMRGHNGGGGGHAHHRPAAGGDTRPARYDAGAAGRRREAEGEGGDRPALYDAWVAMQRQTGGGDVRPVRYNAAEMMQRREARGGAR